MPANKKYLTASPWQRLLKVTAAIFGGYWVTASLLLFLLHFLNKKDVMVTMKFCSYLVWVVLMILAILSKSGWKVWLWYFLIGIVFLSPTIYALIIK